MFRKQVQTVVRIEAQIAWLARQDPATHRWLAVCPALNLNAVGDTYEELQACGNEAMALLFLDLIEEGEIDSFLRQHGWTMAGKPQPGSHPRFDIPADWSAHARREELFAARA